MSYAGQLPQAIDQADHLLVRLALAYLVHYTSLQHAITFAVGNAYQKYAASHLGEAQFMIAMRAE